MREKEQRDRQIEREREREREIKGDEDRVGAKGEDPALQNNH